MINLQGAFITETTTAADATEERDKGKFSSLLALTRQRIGVCGLTRAPVSTLLNDAILVLLIVLVLLFTQGRQVQLVICLVVSQTMLSGICFNRHDVHQYYTPALRRVKSLLLGTTWLPSSYMATVTRTPPAAVAGNYPKADGVKPNPLAYKFH